MHINDVSLSATPSADYPVIASFGVLPLDTQSTNFPSVSAKAAYVMDESSYVGLYAKDSIVSLPMASTTKIMTALVAFDNFSSNDVLIIKNDMLPDAKIGFPLGEKVYFLDILYAMLLASGNDAAMAIAQNYPGGKDAFVNAMNEKARNLHLVDMHFADPTGLDDNNYTSAQDLAKLAALALQNKTFAQVVSTKRYTFKNVLGSRTYTVTNINKLLGVEGITGVKTGFTDRAGEVLVTSRVEDGHRIIMVVMNSEDRFADTQILVSFFKGGIQYLSF